LIDIAPP